jgi:acyl-coenzyme A thioesterase PaaI-like protein
VTDPAEPLGELARAVRALADATADRQLGAAEAAEATAMVQGAVAVLAGAGARRRDIAAMAAPIDAREGQLVRHFDHCVVCGPLNGGGLGITARWRGDAVVADVTLGPAHEGAPGIAHGGIVSLLFDDVLAYPASVLAGFVVTTDLSVKYVAPTPVGVPLELVARCSLDAGDRFVVTGSLSGGGRVTAMATGWFRTGSRDLLRGARGPG